VTGAIVGARSPEQVDGWIRAGETELTREGLDEIGRTIDRIHARHRPGTSAFHESERELAKTKRAGNEA
jgi:hypothetical protein